MSRAEKWSIATVLGGLLAGLVATVPMSAFFSAAQGARQLSELPPRKVVASVSPQLSEPDQVPVATISHYLVGGGAGVAYQLATTRITRGPISGIAWGLLVWLFGYEFLMPRATGMPLAHRDDRRRAASILVAHVIFGGVLGIVGARLSRGRR